MSVHVLSERLFEALIEGNRSLARSIVNEQLNEGVSPELMLTDLFWPTYEMIDKLHREDQISALAYNLSTRLFRVLVDQTSRALINGSNAEPVNRTVLACCGTCEGSELGAQMAVDLLEAAGFNVRFAGGGVPLDEVRPECAGIEAGCPPDVLLESCGSP